MFWDYGEVINDPFILGTKVKAAFGDFDDRYRNMQEVGLKSLIFKGEKSASAIASEAIISILID